MPLLLWLLVTVPVTALFGPPLFLRGVDPQLNRGHYRAGAVEYRTWTSSPTILPDGSCHYAVFALVTREWAMVARMQGEGQPMDWSWTREWTLKRNERASFRVEFLDPLDGRVVAEHEVGEWCEGR